MAQAAAVAESHDALSNSVPLGAVATAHGAGVCADTRIVLPKHAMGLPLKKLGLYGFAVVFDGTATRTGTRRWSAPAASRARCSARVLS